MATAAKTYRKPRAKRVRAPRKDAKDLVPISIIVDTREPEPLLWQLSQEGFDVSRQTMSTGDFLWITKDFKSVCIERKTVSDLLSSLAKRQGNGKPRVVNQLGRLSQTFDYPVLLIEGSMVATADGNISADGRPSTWAYNSIDNFLLTAQQAGVLVVRCRKGEVPTRIRSLVYYFDKVDHLLPVRQSKDMAPDDTEYLDDTEEKEAA